MLAYCQLLGGHPGSHPGRAFCGLGFRFFVVSQLVGFWSIWGFRPEGTCVWDRGYLEGQGTQ